MAGLYDRVHADSVDRVAVHFLTAGFKLVQIGRFTMNQFKAGLSATLIRPLGGQAEKDLDDIWTEVQTAYAVSAGHGADYLHLIESLCISTEYRGVPPETQWRNDLGIPDPVISDAWTEQRLPSLSQSATATPIVPP